MSKAGGLVIRAVTDPFNPDVVKYQVIVVQTQNDKWGYPKGSKKPREKLKDAALREVREETGYTCRTLAKLLRIGLPGTKVTYWLMEVDESVDRAAIEVPDVRACDWVGFATASRILTRPADRHLLVDALRVIERKALAVAAAPA